MTIPVIPTTDVAPYDALLLHSFGGPEGPDDVMPFLRNVTAGRGIPDERLEQVAEHYLHFGGRSPINDQNAALLAALRAELDRRGVTLPTAWGNRNWDPFVTDTLRELHDAGHRRVLVLTTSAYACYSSCRQYGEDLARALATLESEGRQIAVDKVRPYFNSPGFVTANTDAVRGAVGSLGGNARTPHVVFVTHSIPTTMEDASGRDAPHGATYRDQHLDLARVVAGRLAAEGVPITWELAFCSRSGPPSQPWLSPDVNDVLEARHAEGVDGVVLAPIGFVSDHMEVVYDLDTEARETAERLGMRMVRAATAGTAEEFVAGLVDLVLERCGTERGEAPQRPAEGEIGPWPDACSPGGCWRRDGEDSGVPAAATRVDAEAVSA
ncbi:ferrochelatase [Beutenbergia cavernae DSM 12333]|uniref:Coproporphyrin III ferrochelatase n=1 Tax=Beutenbergia cavernae (strain ATCC BAA-8 / DSM 12333 / CCUG 43141 / JCM 11478 / NBRC 16432 / NCIMB 13614 / HKI 0122) TaxID=471853 RepID=C5C0U4_BEUC1|nr:ferrochelatase [Beutenbergia cavernae]ACQ79348.1 ferrochelatase [Beutenbergia cavernae DSM 12333]